MGRKKKKTTQSNLLESKQAFKTSLVSAALISELVSGKSAHSSHQDLKPLSGSLGRLGKESVRCFFFFFLVLKHNSFQPGTALGLT